MSNRKRKSLKKFIILTLTGVFLALIVFNFFAKKTQAAWFDDNWDYLTIKR